MKDLNWDDKGYLVDGKRISNLRFADDIVLISTSTAEVEKMLNELNVAGMKIGLDMNMSKTQFVVNQLCDTRLIRLNGVALQQVDSYVYLGRGLTWITTSLLKSPAGDAQRGQPSVRFARSSIRSRMPSSGPRYSTPLYYLRCVTQRKVARAMQTTHRAMERCLLRTGLRQQWQEGRRSSELRKKTQLADPLQYTKKSKYRWVGHLLR
ncbi:unnamed protein product [Heligmosomoides polygyrus]|uniref:Reverse transcriptase domain-containing protein n=1 Tax=Heligmosomoides polygyrus TaxID=6339 RepID=A0A183GHF2_HELPZ|nr:unnamed protein product [Heligmosomoides polygyrus]